MGLRGVLDNNKPARACDLNNRIHVGWLTEKVDGDDRFRSRGDRLFDQSRVHCVGQRVDIDEHRLCSAKRDGLCGSHERIWDGNDFVSDPIPDARSASQSASVPLPTPMAYSQPQ